MKFYTSFSEDRPIRLSEKTREFARESLEGRYGKEALSPENLFVQVPMPLKGSQPLDCYDAAIEAIAKNAPIRICEGEKVSGSANLGMAIRYAVPARFSDGEFIAEISHLTVDFFEILAVGCDGIEARAAECADHNTDRRKERFYQSVLHCLKCFRIYHRRYVEALEGRPGYEENLKALRYAPLRGAGNFREAVQTLWFAFAFLRICGNWPGIGRIDVLLGDYLRNDLAKGDITIDEARELLAHFFIKGCEWVNGTMIGSGDAQHYQNIVLSGIDENKKDVTNEVTFLVLDVVEELPIGDFPITVRISPNTDPKLLRRVAEVVRYGGGTVAVYNEPIILSALERYGYAEKDRLRFANDGCWEVQVPGETCFGYIPFDGLAILQYVTLKNYERTDFESFDELYAAYIKDLSAEVGRIENEEMKQLADRDAGRFIENMPCTVVSIFVKDCIARGLSYLEGGPKYRVISPHIGGIADIVNSLYAIKKLVFDDKKIAMPELFAILKNNWSGNEELRHYAMTHYRYFGNDNEEADAIYRALVRDYAEVCKIHDGETEIMFPAGISTFGRQIEWAHHRAATPYGTYQKEVLSGNSSPTPGTDYEGVTSVIKSYCSADLSLMVTGTALDLELPAETVKGTEGLDTLISLINGFVALGGYFMQIDVADAKILREAQAHPEKYQTLSVRVSGWNARFATLDKSWQDMVIKRAGGEA